MGRQVKRVISGFDWPLEKIWKGYVNPWAEFQLDCYACDGSGYSEIAESFYDQWYGKTKFDPVQYGSQLITLSSPALNQFVEKQVDKSIERSKHDKGQYCYYTDGGTLDREEAIILEKNRLIALFNKSWSNHLIQEDVNALVTADRLMYFTYRPLNNIPLEEYIRTRAYYLWLEAGQPDTGSDNFWSIAEKEHDSYWLPFKNGYIPTAQEVNDWNILGMGHDSINANVCIKARCKRENQEYSCLTCKGKGNIWLLEDGEEKYNSWQPEEPPAGEAYQVWETVSDGSPISPAFNDPAELAVWMSKQKPWGATAKMTSNQWFKWIIGEGELFFGQFNTE